ncbi:hypothetical protein [Pedococcus bigeumensis]|uniref:Uncharacterized protein n=1 Tax=Pedococcus bigeumensis TaxID=433644 RepID=A0A502D4I3_9MICO|nr:hypothetical protein [Pedococcus bigeumensis]TPG19309.1 hypothetical protein EAH86_02060 [Pedococcus bigeumensis]
MSIVAKRALLAALTVIGLVLLLVGAWFTVHLGSSGSAVLRSTPASDAVVVIEPSVLNRVDRPVSITAVAAPGTKIWMGRTTPTDAEAIVGGADRTSVTGAHIRDWSLVQSRSGAGTAPNLASADIWRQTASGDGRVRITVDQSGAPESVVIAAPDGKPVDLTSLRVTIARPTWFFQALLATLVGLLATVAGAAGLWQSWRHPTRGPALVPADGPDDGPDEASADRPDKAPVDQPDTDEPTQEVSA